MNRNLALEFVRVTEAAAMAAARWMGRGNEKMADQAAVDAMRSMLDSVNCSATVVIGEGERDKAPMLYIGEKVGQGQGPELELAVDPLEGTTVCAQGRGNSISAMAIGQKGSFLHAPDLYMEKIAVGPGAVGTIDITDPPKENLMRVAQKKKCRVEDLTAVILDRPRHQGLIQQVRETKARIQLIGDGDVAGAIACCMPDSGVDILFGTGGAPEGVIAAAALRSMGGDFQGILRPSGPEQSRRARQMGIVDLDKIYNLEDLAAKDVMFCATGVTTGNMLKGVSFGPWGATTHSVVMRSLSGTIRYISAQHHFDKKPRY